MKNDNQRITKHAAQDRKPNASSQKIAGNYLQIINAQTNAKNKLRKYSITASELIQEVYFQKKAEAYCRILNDFSLVHEPKKDSIATDSHLDVEHEFEVRHERAKKLISYFRANISCFIHIESLNSVQEKEDFELLSKFQEERTIQIKIDQCLERKLRAAFITLDMLESLKQLKEIYRYLDCADPLSNGENVIKTLLGFLDEAIEIILKIIISNKLLAVEKWLSNLPDKRKTRTSSVSIRTRLP